MIRLSTRVRQSLRGALLLAPGALVAALDAYLRGRRLLHFDAQEWAQYGVSLIAGAVLWAVLLRSSVSVRPYERRTATGLFAVLFTASCGAQAYFFQQYNAYMNRFVTTFATDFGESVMNQLVSDARNYLSFMCAAAVMTVALLVGARKLWPHHGTERTRLQARLVARGWLAPVLVMAALFAPVVPAQKQPSSPDLLYLNAMGAMLQTQLGFSKNSHKQRPRARRSLSVPVLRAKPQAPRNVVFVVLESVRKDATCVEYAPDCSKTQATNLGFPSRIALPELRALDSCTAISMAVLYAGVAPTESREVLHSWPLLFDYARQAGYDTGYFTSQNLMFGNMRLWLGNLGVRHMFSALDIDPESHMDMGVREQLFAERAVEEIQQLKEPYFLTIQLSNGHYPYLVEAELAQPFQPATQSKAPEDNEAFFRHYQNAVHQEDMHLARVLKALRARPDGERTVFVVTSDHGEAFREHGQMGHTFSTFDEEVHVPGWIDAPAATLSATEREHLLRNAEQFAVHPDLTATILDLLGVWDAPEMRRFQERIIGRSLLRPWDSERVFPMTNCAGVWTCAFENWGVIRGPQKVMAREWDSEYRCFNVLTDPEESHGEAAQACGDLLQRAREKFSTFPGERD